MEQKKKQAIKMFNNGYNCAQAVLSAFAEDYGLNKSQYLKIAAVFGGGMARQQSVCGSVTASYMIIGLHFGDKLKKYSNAKEKLFSIVNDFNSEFSKKNESVICKEILGYDLKTEEGRIEINKQNLFKIKCEKAIKTAIDILDKILK